MLYQLLSVLLATSYARAAPITLEVECLAAHNFYRALHPGTPPLKWNKRLQREAQEWADDLARRNAFEHAHNPSKGHPRGVYIGENIRQEYKKTCADAVKVWYDERKYYSYRHPGLSGATGHFTQVVWKATTEVGVAMASRKVDGATKWWTVARYKPGGNDGGAQEYRANVLPPNRKKWEISLTNLRKEIAKMTNTDSPFGNCKNVKSEAECDKVNCDSVVSWYTDGYGKTVNTYGYEDCPSTCNKCNAGVGDGNYAKKPAQAPEPKKKTATKGNCKNKEPESYCKNMVTQWWNECDKVKRWETSPSGVRVNTYGYQLCASTCNRCPKSTEIDSVIRPPTQPELKCEDTESYCQSVPRYYSCKSSVATKWKHVRNRWIKKTIYARDVCKKSCNNCHRSVQSVELPF